MIMWFKPFSNDNAHNFLLHLGIVQGDVICGFLPNSYQTAVAMFATAAIGATWSSASVDFGPSGVLDRFKQVFLNFSS